MRFRPTLWATLATVPVLAVLIALGLWQMQRLEWKEALIATRAERVVSPILDMVPRDRVSERLEPGQRDLLPPPDSGIAVIANDAESYEYRPVRLAGFWQHDKAMHLVGRTWNGEVGEHVVTPLNLAQGAIVLVDRGWVPPRGATGAPRGYDRPAGRVVVEGYVRLFPTPGYFTPDNAPQTDTWYWLDPVAAAAVLGEVIVTGFYVQAAPAKAVIKPPVGSVPELKLRNPHLQYALTWFGVAGALVAVYIAFHVRRRDEDA